MDKTIKIVGIVVLMMLISSSCNSKKNKKMEKANNNETSLRKKNFGYDKLFLKKHYKNTIVLESEDKKSSIILSPELQGRVMTSTLNGDDGMSFGWLNYNLIESKKTNKHFNPTGGEERFWLGPEGGQFSIYFKPNTSFEFENWYVPTSIDIETFNVNEQDKNSVLFQKEMSLINYSGTKFKIDVQRKVTLLSKDQIVTFLHLDSNDFSSVAYETTNLIKNIGNDAWEKESGLVSVWLLSMLTPSSEVTVVIPINEGVESEKGIKVNDNYFGKVSIDRLKTTEQSVYFRTDGKSRGKIGVSPLRATAFMGSYDAKNKTLTILQISEPKANDKYVNSAWEIQNDPFSGDVLNSYNDGPLEDGTQMGPFYELESSSPGLALKPEEIYTHTQRIYHFKGSREVLNNIAKSILKVTIEDIEEVFKNEIGK